MGVEGGPVAVDKRGAELLFGELTAACFAGVSVFDRGGLERYVGCEAWKLPSLGEGLTILVYSSE